jgi:hypothetical protein
MLANPISPARPTGWCRTRVEVVQSNSATGGASANNIQRQVRFPRAAECCHALQEVDGRERFSRRQRDGERGVSVSSVRRGWGTQRRAIRLATVGFGR